MQANVQIALALSCLLAAAPALSGQPKPYREGRFTGRIACSADGNHNDPDDWIASPMALAILAGAGLKDHLVHFDYNSILTDSDPAYEEQHRKSIQQGAALYGYDPSIFHNDRTDLDQAIASIASAVNESSAGDPLYFIVAGPMEVPYRGLLRADAAKRPYVYCISHSRWNDGYDAQYRFRFTKRALIELGVVWVQIPDQNRRLSTSPYGRPAAAAEFKPYFWLRDSTNANAHFLWDRMIASTRPDPSDAGMAYFLATGNEQCDPQQLELLLAGHQKPAPPATRPHIRIEAENFRELGEFQVDDRQDKHASHRLGVTLAGSEEGRMWTPFDSLFILESSRYDAEIRYWSGGQRPARYTFLINGAIQGGEWVGTSAAPGWQSRIVEGVLARVGDKLEVIANGPSAKLDYLQLNVSGAAP